MRVYWVSTGCLLNLGLFSPNKWNQTVSDSGGQKLLHIVKKRVDLDLTFSENSVEDSSEEEEKDQLLEETSGKTSDLEGFVTIL